MRMLYLSSVIKSTRSRPLSPPRRIRRPTSTVPTGYWDVVSLGRVSWDCMCFSLGIGLHFGKKKKKEKDRNKRRSVPCGNVDSGHQNVSGAQTHLSPEPRHQEQPLIGRCSLHCTALPLAPAWSRGQCRDPPVLLRLRFNGNFTAAAFWRCIAVWYKKDASAQFSLCVPGG